MALQWNDRVLASPPIYTKKLHQSRLSKKSINFASFQPLKPNPPSIDLSALRQLFNTMITTYSTITFDETGALTSRLIARRTNSFRSQAGFKALRKTNIALCRLKDINIVGVLDDFSGTLPDYIANGVAFRLPTYDCFEFVMLRLQSLSKLLLRIAICARESATIFRDMIQRNFFIDISALYIAMLSQIWDVAKRLSIQTRDFYNTLYAYGKYFPIKSEENVDGVSVNLCEKLEKFFTNDWTNEFVNRVDDHGDARKCDKQENELGLDFGDFTDDGENILVLREEKPKPMQVIELKKSTVEIKNRSIGDDIGVAISRDSLEEIVKVDQIVRMDEISKLINEEQSLRDKKCAKRTRHLSDAQWKDVRSKVRNLLVTSNGKMCIKKFKQLWKTVAK